MYKSLIDLWDALSWQTLGQVIAHLGKAQTVPVSRVPDHINLPLSAVRSLTQLAGQIDSTQSSLAVSHASCDQPERARLPVR